MYTPPDYIEIQLDPQGWDDERDVPGTAIEALTRTYCCSSRDELGFVERIGEPETRAKVAGEIARLIAWHEAEIESLRGLAHGLGLASEISQ